jgi:hypothetical protein
MTSPRYSRLIINGLFPLSVIINCEVKRVRQPNVGTWISRLQKKEYNLRATGWVRMVSGLQSLLSVYMLALWALTYFGRPFE